MSRQFTSMPVPLADLQAQFVSALLTPADTASMCAHFSTESQPQERFSFYRGNLIAIWNSALKNAYPVLFELVGGDFFEQMARAYGHAYPSQTGDLNEFGANLSDFLFGSHVAADYPYFAEIAALEWQLHRAYYAADDTILTIAEFLSEVARQGLEATAVGLRTHATASLHSSAWATIDIWTAHQGSAGREAPDRIDAANYGLLSRPEWQVSVLPVSAAAFRALQALFDGLTLGQALECALSEDANFDIGANLQQWFSVGAFSGIKK